MTFPPLDPLSWIPDATKREILDGLLKFLMDKAGKTLGDEFTGVLGKLRSDAAFQDAIDAGLKRATDRFLREYADEDEDLTAALSADREFWKAKSVRDALLAILRQPGRWEAQDWETVASRFDDVLPQRRNRERVDKAVRFFLRCLAEEVWHLPELRPIYEMQMQRVSLEKAEVMLHEVHGMRADFQQAMLALAQGIAEQQKLLASAARPALPEPPRVYHNLPTPDYIHFVGREKELADLRRLLSPDHRIGVISIDGIGGIGKSALALEIAHRYLREFDQLPEQERFQAIIWASAKAAVLTADGIATRQQITRTLGDIYTTIAVTLQREDITRSYQEDQDEVLCRALSRQRTLLIIDNLETIDDGRVNAFLRELPIPTKCVVTTRHRIDVAYPIRLTAMPREDALALIVQECERKSITLNDEEADLLYRRTGGVPLAIVWSISQMGYGYGVQSVLRRLGDAKGDIARYCFEGALERIRGKPSQNLLIALSLFATDASRVALSYIVRLPELDKDDALAELVKLSLVNKQVWKLPLPDKQAEIERFSLLPMTKGFARDLQDNDQSLAQSYRQKWIEYYADFVSQHPFRVIESRELLEIERENIIEVIEQIWVSGQVQTHEDLLNGFFIFLWRRGHWAEAVRQATKLLDWANNNRQTRMQARFEHWLGRLYLSQNLLDKAETHLMLASERYVEDDWQWVSVRTYLAQAHVRRKIPLKAEEILKSALVRASKQEGDPGRGSARIFNVFAEICLNAGQIQEAQVYLNRALAICEDKILHVTVLGRTYYLLARTNMQLKQFDPAEIWMGKYLDLALKEGFVQDVATAKFGMAQIQYSKGRPYEASRLAEEARYLFERIGMHQETVDCDSFLVETKQSLQ